MSVAGISSFCFKCKFWPCTSSVFSLVFVGECVFFFDINKKHNTKTETTTIQSFSFVIMSIFSSFFTSCSCSCVLVEFGCAVLCCASWILDSAYLTMLQMEVHKLNFIFSIQFHHPKKPRVSPIPGWFDPTCHMPNSQSLSITCRCESSNSGVVVEAEQQRC